MNRLKGLLEMLEELQGEIRKEITRLKSVLAYLPEGSLQLDYKNGPGREQYYIKKPGEKRRYLSKKKDANLILQLGDKRYIIIALKNLEENLEAIAEFLKKANGNIGVYLADQLEMKGIHTTGKTCLSAKKKQLNWIEARKWEKMLDRKRNAKFYEKFKDWEIFETLAGDKVRSKGEGLIADILFTNNIAYAYETRLEFGNEHKYSDFVIYDPYTDREIIYEHFGRMDKNDYIYDTVRKLLLYLEHGLRPGIDFIFTFETKTKPLTTKKICEVVSEHITNVDLKVA